MMDASTERRINKISNAVFWSFEILAQVIGVAVLVTVGIWLSKYFGGFDWGKVPSSFHAFFGVFGLVIVSGEAILFTEVSKRLNLSVIVQKAVHATIHTCAIIFTIVSVCAAIKNKNINDANHLYSLHSWLGLLAIILFFFQYVAACVMYGVARRVGDWLTDLYQNTHAYSGLFIFALSIATCLTGFMEKVVENIIDFDSLPPAAVLANVSCILLVLFGACVAYGASRPDSRFETPRPTVEEYNTASAMDKEPSNEKQEEQV